MKDKYNDWLLHGNVINIVQTLIFFMTTCYLKYLISCVSFNVWYFA